MLIIHSLRGFKEIQRLTIQAWNKIILVLLQGPFSVNSINAPAGVILK